MCWTDWEKGFRWIAQLHSSSQPTSDVAALYLGYMYRRKLEVAVICTRAKLCSHSMSAQLAPPPPPLQGDLGYGSWALSSERARDPAKRARVSISFTTLARLQPFELQNLQCAWRAATAQISLHYTYSAFRLCYTCSLHHKRSTACRQRTKHYNYSVKFLNLSLSDSNVSCNNIGAGIVW